MPDILPISSGREHRFTFALDEEADHPCIPGTPVKACPHCGEIYLAVMMRILAWAYIYKSSDDDDRAPFWDVSSIDDAPPDDMEVNETSITTTPEGAWYMRCRMCGKEWLVNPVPPEEPE